MKIILLLVVLSVGAALYYVWSGRPAPAPNAAERYASSLRNDVKRAEDAAAKANAAVKREEDSAKASLDEAEKK